MGFHGFLQPPEHYFAVATPQNPVTNAGVCFKLCVALLFHILLCFSLFWKRFVLGKASEHLGA